MKKILFILSVAFIGHAAEAQVTMQPGLPAMGLIQKSQLWNVLVINNSVVPYNAKLELVLRDRSTGLELMTAASGIFELKAGAKQLNPAILNPIQYNYLSNTIDSRIQGLLPPGNYTVCYSLTATGVKETILGEECVSFDVEPLSPPMLIFPADSSVLKEDPSQFSWIPPTPAGMFNRLKYEVIITEVLEGQKGNEAIAENLPFFNDAYQVMTNMTYPTTSNKFEKEKWYAWQVIARDDANYAGKSEVWTFKINKEPKKETETPGKSYFSLGGLNDQQDICYLENSILDVKYYSYDKEHVAVIKIIQADDGQVIKELSQKIIYGNNYLSFELNGLLAKGKLYKLLITGRGGEKHYLSFRLKK